ncbi:MAG: 4-hydroxyphenylpyruvate dioxygenase [Myxococcota bacterium]
MVSETNPLGLHGIDFVEFSSPNPGNLDEIFTALGFSLLKQHTDKAIDYYSQNDIHFFVNREDEGFAADFRDEHGPSICSMGFRVEDAQAAFDTAVSRGAKPVGDDVATDLDLPAIWGIGDSLVYFVDQWGEGETFIETRFDEHENPTDVESKGFLRIDHLTNNVYQGTKQEWANFYKDVFGFREIRFFDIKGKKTGLTSYALASPCGTFSLPINESSDEKSQIEEYLNEYGGPGIQHLALLTNDLLDSLDAMEGGPIDTLDIDSGYYEEVFDRVPNVVEDHDRIEHHDVLVDGDEDGYLLQIFTKNIIGPIFFELIQRKNHKSFGEGNFQALFESIERDQEKRGVL